MSDNRPERVLAIDLGGTKIALGVVDAGGKILVKGSAPTPRGDPLAVVGKAREIAAAFGHELEGVGALGIALPGILDSRGEILESSPSSSWTMVPFTSLFAREFNLPAAAENDANACAIAEARFGAGKGLKSFFWMTVSTGVGGAFFLDGKPLRGFHGMAGEIGHLVVRPRGRLCTCGNSGCLEAEAAGPAWVAKAAQARPGWIADAAAIARGARAGDELCLGIVDDVADALARGIASVLNLLDPEAVFLGGGVAGASDLLVPRIKNLLPSLVVAGATRMIRIEPSALGYDAALLGAAALGLRK
jgi:glucokinase